MGKKSKNEKKERNYAFVDGQNLYMGLDFKLDYKRFRIYLKDKYKVEKAYYFLGFKENERELYESLQEAGFILVFNLKGEDLKSNKKGNVDVCLVFSAMRKLVEESNDFDNILLVSGDGDYKIMVDYFVEIGKFKKVLAPNLKYTSTLYKNHNLLNTIYFDFLNKESLRSKLEYKKKKAP